MGRPFVEAIIQTMIWLNILGSLSVVLLLQFSNGIVSNATSKTLERPRNAVVFFLIWMIGFTLAPLVIFQEYQSELSVELLHNYAAAAFSLGPFFYIVLSLRMSKGRMNGSDNLADV